MMSKRGFKQSPPESGGVARSAGVVCSKTRSHLTDAREAILMKRSASRISVRSALRADFEQTAPALRATPPNLGGDYARE
jgi:hypothetical protein